MKKIRKAGKKSVRDRKRRFLAAALSLVLALVLCVSPQMAVSVQAEEPEANDFIITTKMEIDEDWTVDGNLTIDASGFLASSKLSLNGHTLTVNGNLIITDAGELDFSHGKVIVNGNLIIGQESTNSDIGNRGCLIMKYEDEELHVAGNFIAYGLGTYNYFDGTMYLGGDFLDKREKPSFFNQNTRFKLVLNGTGKQLLSLGSSDSYFNKIIIPDDYKGEIYISNYFVFSQLGCDLEVTCDTTEYEKTYIGQYEAYGMNFNGHTLTVNGDVSLAGLWKLAGGRLVINGDVMQTSSSEIGAVYVELGDGELDIQGSYTVEELAYTRMQDSDGSMHISKDFVMRSDSRYNLFTAGTMYIGGDVTATNFFPFSSHTVVLIGETLQNIDFGDSGSHFNNLMLTKDKKTGYTFLPENCWEKIVCAQHSGGTATCKDKAVCEICGEPYGELDSDNHAGETEIRGEKPVSHTEPGYTGDTFCKGCGARLQSGTEVPAEGHTFKEVIDKAATTSAEGSKHEECTVCGYKKAAVSIPKLEDDASAQKPGHAVPAVSVNTTLKDPSTNATVKVSNAGKVANGKVTGAEVTYTKPAVSRTTVTVPDSVTINGVEYSVTSVEKGAFKDDKKLAEVTIGSNVKTIGADAFSGCKKLTTVKMGKNVKSIGNNAFANDTKLSAMTIGANATTVGNKAFYKCTSLKSVTIPAKVTKLGSSAFSGCKSLKTVTFKGTKAPSIGKDTLKGIKKNATIKVPKKQYNAYKKKLTAKTGYKKTMKIKKA